MMYLQYENPDFINSSEAVSDFFSFGNSVLIIPYYNLPLMDDNPINQKASFVEFSFYILFGVQKVTVYSESTSFEILNGLLKEAKKKEHLGVGGYRDGFHGAEIVVDYDHSILYIPVGSNVSYNDFTQFEIKDDLPKEMSEIIGINSYKIVI